MDSSDQSLNLSTVSSRFEEDTETRAAKNYVKDLLKSRIFLGRYIERRLINKHIGYRDIVLISAAEVELKRDLLAAQEKLRAIFPESHWIGISDSHMIGLQSGLYLSAEIDNEPLGPFWFQIKTIKFRPLETIVVLKCIRHISDGFLELEPILTGAPNKSIIASIPSNKKEVEHIKADITETIKDVLSIHNIRDFFTFIFAFVIAVFTGSTSFVNFLGNFILALIRELSLLVKNSTPMFLGVLDFFSKIVGGFYILMAMFFRPNNPPRPNKRIVEYDQPDFKYRNFD
ncbi:uncharacterized protein LOC121733603 [Aricia agestis]|uniref:uncharacterized protein LOC121733603 n=1 Tax=Aricia agestis TaxID=91739 RepID=UPI001C2041B7|nr:uncharacterized protein LOC121733603 [Aricia agestis]XP_041979833.1 uncharacterized protein LOC121733603 [Aricia agestis]